jgi:hypothetical protein
LFLFVLFWAVEVGEGLVGGVGGFGFEGGLLFEVGLDGGVDVGSFALEG